MLRRRLERVAVVVVGLLQNRVDVLRLSGFRSVLLHVLSFLSPLSSSIILLVFSEFRVRFFRLWLLAECTKNE